MNTGVTYRTIDLGAWNDTRRNEIQLDALARAYLSDPEVADRDRIAFALRELRGAGYDVEARPVDWTQPRMICSLYDSELMSFGAPEPSTRHRRLARIADRQHVADDPIRFERLLGGLYDEGQLYDTHDVLEEPYEFDFLGDSGYVEGVLQAVGFATRLGVSVADDGSARHHVIKVAPPAMVMDPSGPHVE
jgi:hypothetical protein